MLNKNNFLEIAIKSQKNEFQNQSKIIRTFNVCS